MKCGLTIKRGLRGRDLSRPYMFDGLSALAQHQSFQGGWVGVTWVRRLVKCGLTIKRACAGAIYAPLHMSRGDPSHSTKAEASAERA